MTLNYITDDSEILYEGQEIFINLSEEKADKIPGFIDKAQPDLSIPVAKPKPTKTVAKTTAATKTSSTTTKTSSSSASAPAASTTTS